MKPKTILALILFLALKISVAQQVISSTGMSVQNGNYQLSWTIGEPLTATLSGGASILTQGFHQSKLTVTSVGEIMNSSLSLKVFPNPFKDELSVEVSNGGKDLGINFALFDTAGKLLIRKEISGSSEKLDMAKYSSGTYLIRFSTENGRVLQTFKVSKSE